MGKLFFELGNRSNVFRLVGFENWLRSKDSNLDYQGQNLMSYL